MNPGETTSPVSSMVRLPVSAVRESAAILPSSIPTFIIRSRFEAGSTTRPLLMTTS